MSKLKTYPTSEGAELDAAVDEFAAAMKKRLRSKLREGFEGWDWMDTDELRERLLRNAAQVMVKTKDKKSMIDVANLSMMLWVRKP